MVVIRTFRPDDADAVRRLFARGQRDFAAGLEAEVEAYISRSLAADLADIPQHYLSQAGSRFWVAEVEGRVRGMVAVQRQSADEGELRRMSVAADVRRRGVGWKLLETVEAFCREQGYQRITLSTVTQLQPAIAMYRRFGFRQVGEEPYGAMTVQFFLKCLATPQSNPADGQS